MTADPPADGTITRVELTCHRLRALRSFYGEHLGLPVRGRKATGLAGDRRLARTAP